MLKLSKKVEYGLIALLHIAELDAGKRVTSREIAEAFRLPPEILGKVMQALTRAELVESIQGAKGGYHIRRALSAITLGDLIIALDGPVHVTPCCKDNYDCDQEATCNIKQPINHLQDQLQQFVHSLTLDQLAKHGGKAYNLDIPSQQVSHVFKKDQ